MFDLLRSQILKRISLTEDEFDLAKTFFIPKKIRKGQFLLHTKEQQIMKRVLSTLVIAFTVAAGAFAQSTWTVDIVHSTVSFSVASLSISEVEGTFKTYSGTLQSSTNDFADAAIEFSIDVNSINTDNGMRDKHLKSDDFFNAEKYPLMTFKSTAWEKIEGKNYLLEGELTIRDVTKPVKFTVTYGGTVKDGRSNVKAGFKATAVVNRFDRNLKWNAATRAGGITVGKDVTVTLNLQFAQKKAS
jgi:polyisoprenoid-binding protein YceI